MKKGSRITAVVLTIVVIGLIALLMREAMSGPVFRAADHASYEDCIANIPREWAPGSLEQTGAEAACGYEHRGRR